MEENLHPLVAVLATALITVDANVGDSVEVMKSAVQALSKLARTSDEKVINSITQLLHPHRNEIRYEAIRVITCYNCAGR